MYEPRSRQSIRDYEKRQCANDEVKIFRGYIAAAKRGSHSTFTQWEV